MVQGGGTTVTAGMPATLDCATSDADPAVTTYTWTVGGTMVSETGSTYMFTPTSAQDNAVVTCSVDNGSPVTDSMTLTVNSEWQ